MKTPQIEYKEELLEKINKCLNLINNINYNNFNEVKDLQERLYDSSSLLEQYLEEYSEDLI